MYNQAWARFKCRQARKFRKLILLSKKHNNRIPSNFKAFAARRNRKFRMLKNNVISRRRHINAYYLHQEDKINNILNSYFPNATVGYTSNVRVISNQRKRKSTVCSNSAAKRKRNNDGVYHKSAINSDEGNHNNEQFDHMEDNERDDEYADNGDCVYKCSSCGAYMWYAETLIGGGKYSRSYSLCCSHGKVVLNIFPKAPPKLLVDLLNGDHPMSKHFIENIRAYNMIFAFTSMAGKVDNTVNEGSGPYTYRLNGQNYHTVGSLVPQSGKPPKFCQLYIYDTANESANRLNAISSRGSDLARQRRSSLDVNLIEEIKLLLDSVDNPLVSMFRMARDRYSEYEDERFSIQLIAQRSNDARNYSLPTADEVAALIVGDIGASTDRRDILLESHTGALKRISELHPSYLALQYPLIHVYGEDGYRVGIPHSDASQAKTKKKKTVSMREYIAYTIQERRHGYSLLLNARKLFQQYMVDTYTMVETERLSYVRYNQGSMRMASYKKVAKAVESGVTDGSSIGKRVVLPSSFTGGSRYMSQNYLDAMALCKRFGNPDIFLTFTCNPKWREIKRHLSKCGLNPEDKPQILSRIFKMKLDMLIKDIKDNQIFGRVNAVVYTIEFQKRGLPHSHICVFLHENDKLPTPSHIDRVISAEIPDSKTDLRLYNLVCEFMIHGPCGPLNPKCPCTVKHKCTKNFPRKFCDATYVDEDGYPVYRRRDNSVFVVKGGHELHNGFVVGYNKYLLKKYRAHINVEWCNQVGSIKYLFKYINKGPDRVSFGVYDSEKDEISEFYDGRYVSACEAAWRMFSFDIHYRKPSVERLPFHLPEEHIITYDEHNMVDDFNHSASNISKFNGWMECNKIYTEARELTYEQFPENFVWKKRLNKWLPRNGCDKIARIYHAAPSSGDLFYLRILLNTVKGPTCFKDIKTVNGKTFSTFKEVCCELGLLDDDQEYIKGIEEASHWGSGNYLRGLFVTLIISGSVSKPEDVWEKTWKLLSDGILHKQKKICKNPGLILSDEQLKVKTLIEIENIMQRNGTSLQTVIGMPYPDEVNIADECNRLIENALSYSVTDLRSEHDSLYVNLTEEQKTVYNRVINAVDKQEGGMFFLYGYGGTGKTYVWKTLSAAVRSRHEIVLNVASSGIAALLLSGGKTAHSQFHIPINIDEDSMCSISPDSDLAGLLRKTKLIIWDEAPMINRHCFEAFDRTLKDILRSNDPNNANKVFGGIVIVFGGDFRQILPVIPRGTRQHIVNASINSSHLWKHCTVLSLTTNMRLKGGSSDVEMQSTKEFADWILRIGNGTVAEPNDGEATVEIPADILLDVRDNPLVSMIETIYDQLHLNLSNSKYFEEKAILAPTNDVVKKINDKVMEMLPGDEKVYLSSDSICKEDNPAKTNLDLYTPDYLNKLELSGLPNHRLCLKVGVPVMLLRNVDQTAGLCNGTRLLVRRLGKHVIEVSIITGTNIGHVHLLPRMPLTSSDKRMPVRFQRRQFPVALCFAMTINKSQGQSLSKVGVYLERPVFTHGQLYVALSRVKSKQGIKVFVSDTEGKPTNCTTNVVYKEVLQKV